MATDVENLKATRSSYLQTLATEAAYQAANGPKPSYTIDGETMQWDTWRDSMTAKIEVLTKMISILQGPVLIRTRGRA